jgi:hypothetical protein
MRCALQLGEAHERKAGGAAAEAELGVGSCLFLLLHCRARSRYSRAAQDEEAAAKAEAAAEKPPGCCGAACAPALLIPGLILFSDLLGSLASGACGDRDAPPCSACCAPHLPTLALHSSLQLCHTLLVLLGRHGQ